MCYFQDYTNWLVEVVQSISYKTCNQPKAPTASQNHPQQPKLQKTNNRHPLSKLTPKQEASVKFFIGVCKWNTFFPGIFKANFKMFSHTGYQKHWVWVSWNPSIQNSFWAYSALLKHHTVTQISQKNLNAFQNFKAYWTECCKYCIIIVESNTEKTENSLFKQNVVITFCLSICLLCFVLALLYSMAEFFHFQSFFISMSQVFIL